ncbi:DeoR/GlpR family DNA-binding transcription regulator [Solicola gregarius]|uniref:Lactose phosphotransferase system repressor n=1 Tax=Solicola gregarius TaxID=2908642 RepID=A0AA46TK49_9ACTN|nr:DeoR/GlpR family DNA-binding transcription regulator [Solicola gregarius]UYM06760.1 DeoR/GlpR family DNA-binding transcription regulator [Solicola gregarius]
MLAQQRYERILERLRTDGPVEVGTLARQLHVSEATVRRDLRRLEDRELVTRLHGGASLPTAQEPPFAHVATSHVPDKDAVAREAAGLVNDGDVLLLDIGTTTHRLAAALRGRTVTIITSSLAVYEELAGDSSVELILLGGVVRRNYRSMVGFLTEQALRQVRAGALFLGTSGVRPDGTVLDTTVVEVPVKQAMIAAAERVVLLADGSKFPGGGLARVCGAAEVDDLVSTEDADPDTLTTFSDSGTVVHLAPTS